MSRWRFSFLLLGKRERLDLLFCGSCKLEGDLRDALVETSLGSNPIVRVH